MADMECCLKVHSKCESCMMKTIEVLRSITGVYSVTWDAEKHIFRIYGEVDPNVLIKAVMHTGEHAELLTVKLNHPQLRLIRNYNNNNNNSCYYGYPAFSSSYPNRDIRSSLPLPPPDHRPGIQYLSSYDTTTTAYNNGHGYYYGTYENPIPRATYVPSYPYQEYDPNANYEGVNFCTIM